MTTWPIRRVRAEAVGPLLALHAAVVRVCAAYAEAQGERWGVWAGVDRSEGGAP